MAKRSASDGDQQDGTERPSPKQGGVLRAPAESLFASEIDALIAADRHERPPGWRMSPRAVVTYITGGTVGSTVVTPKYIGHQRLVEIAISTLVTDRALLLIGEPGTAKSWLSEHLAAAINGDSTKVVQGTAGTTEEHVRYSWNYAMLIARGPSPEALIPSPILRAMESGSIARFEEVTRCASEVQDAMISILSEKTIAIPELKTDVPARRGFSVIATANTRDKGVNDMSAALKRRFNIVVLPSPKTIESEIEIVSTRVRDLATNLQLRAKVPTAEAVEKVVTIFRELRTGQTLDGKAKLKTPSGVLSTAEAISVLASSMALAGNFGTGDVTAADLASAIQGAVVKDEEKDRVVWQEYLTNVLKKRGAEWRPLFTACSEQNDAPPTKGDKHASSS
jgi:MoxR-like ATPase